MHIRITFGLLCVLFAAQSSAETSEKDKPEFVPTSEFQTKDVEGWKIHVHKVLLKDERQLGADVLKEIETQLYRVRRVIPAEPLKKLQEIPIWIHMVKIGSDVRSPLAEYHWSADWLRDHGRNPDMVRSIEIGDMRSFLGHTRHKPFLMLHELAHGYHERILTSDEDKEIRAIYDRAMKKDLYKNVLQYHGKTGKAYAATVYKEYFAEVVVAFYGTCRNYPFVRAELKQYDPDACAFVEKVLHRR